MSDGPAIVGVIKVARAAVLAGVFVSLLVGIAAGHEELGRSLAKEERQAKLAERNRSWWFF